jgi:hypothetical protein
MKNFLPISMLFCLTRFLLLQRGEVRCLHGKRWSQSREVMAPAPAQAQGEATLATEMNLDLEAHELELEVESQIQIQGGAGTEMKE